MVVRTKDLGILVLPNGAVVAEQLTLETRTHVIKEKDVEEWVGVDISIVTLINKRLLLIKQESFSL